MINFFFAMLIVQSLFFMNLKFQAFSYFLWLYSPVCVRNPEKRHVFSQLSSISVKVMINTTTPPCMHTILYNITFINNNVVVNCLFRTCSQQIILVNTKMYKIVSFLRYFVCYLISPVKMSKYQHLSKMGNGK